MGKIRKPAKKNIKFGNGKSNSSIRFDGYFTYYIQNLDDESTYQIIDPSELKPLAEYLLKCDAYLKQQKKEKKK